MIISNTMLPIVVTIIWMLLIGMFMQSYHQLNTSKQDLGLIKKDENNWEEKNYLINSFRPVTEGLGSAMALHNVMLQLGNALNFQVLYMPISLAHGLDMTAYDDPSDEQQPRPFFNMQDNLNDPTPAQVAKAVRDGRMMHHLSDWRDLNLDPILFPDSDETRCTSNSIALTKQLLLDELSTILSTTDMTNLVNTLSLASSSKKGFLLGVTVFRDTRVNYRTGLHFEQTRSWFQEHYRPLPAPVQHFPIVVHHRRNILSRGVNQGLDVERLFNRFEKEIMPIVKQMEEELNVVLDVDLYTEGKADDFISIVNHYPCVRLHLGTPKSTLQDFDAMVQARVLFTDRSSFSMLAAVVGNGMLVPDILTFEIRSRLEMLTCRTINPMGKITYDFAMQMQ